MSLGTTRDFGVIPHVRLESSYGQKHTHVVGVRMRNKQRGVNLIVYRIASGTCTATTIKKVLVPIWRPVGDIYA